MPYDDSPQSGRGKRAPLSAPNPFKPVSFEERLSAPIKKTGHTQRTEALRPGQLYHGGYEMPIFDDTAQYHVVPENADMPSYDEPYEYGDASRYDEPMQYSGASQPLSFHPPVYRAVEPPMPITLYAQPTSELPPIPPERTIPAYLKKAPLAPARPLAPMPAPPYAPPYMPPSAQPSAAEPSVFTPAVAPAAEPVVEPVATQRITGTLYNAVPDSAAPDRVTPAADAEKPESTRRSRMHRYREEEDEQTENVADDAQAALDDAPMLIAAQQDEPASPPVVPFPFEYAEPLDPARAPFFDDAPAYAPPATTDEAAFDPYARFRDVEAFDRYDPPAVPDEVEAFFQEPAKPADVPQQELNGDAYQPDIYQPDAPQPEPNGDVYQPDPFQPDTYSPDAYQPDTPQPEPTADIYQPDAYQPDPVDTSRSQTPPSKPEGQDKPPPADRAAQPKPPRPPRRKLRVGRLLSLVAVVGMVLFCAIAGGSIIADLARNDREMNEFRKQYQEQNGVQPEQDAALVVLPSPGVTFAPTATPVPVTTPSPEPRFAVNDPGIEALNRINKENEEKARREAEQSGEQTPIPEDTSTPEPTATPRAKLIAYPNNPLGNILEEVQTLRAENPDAVGRLTIDGVLDEIVVQRNNTFYLTHNHRGTSSKYGAVFVDESCQFRTPPENLLLRGQSGVEGRTFAPLWQYQTAGSAFVSSAAIATLTTPYEKERYVLFAVVVADSDPSSAGYFSYASHPSFTTDEEMLSYVDSAVARSLYRFNVSVAATDRLLTLATVGGDQGKTMVLLFRMMRQGEGAR